MGYAPYSYEAINNIAGHNNPSSIKARNNVSFAFWERALFQRALSVIDFSFPNEWAGTTKDFMLYVLFRLGYGCVANDAEYGLFLQPCTLTGYDFYYQPTTAIVANPAFNGSKQYEIGKDCAIIKLTPDYMGCWDIIDYYAEKLSLLDNAINMSLVNGKFSYMLGAKNKSAAQALKKMFDLSNKGEPLIVFDQRILDDTVSKDTPFQYLDLGVKNHYLTTEQLQDFQTILSNFDTEIGIPTLPTEKKERMITDEANSKQLEAVARATVWVNTLKSSMKVCNELFGTSLNAELRFKPEQSDNGGEEDGNM